MTPPMTQQDVAAAVERADLVQAVIRATEDGDHHPHISQWAAEQAVATVLSALQQRSGAVERERVDHVCRAVVGAEIAMNRDEAMEAARQIITAAGPDARAILGGQSCPPPPNPEGKPS